jgi:hypothetical protein
MAGVALLIFARSAIFVFWEQAYFDSDQAVIGLMGKHLSELRAFPVFMYGQSYILAVEPWLAAPLFLVFGVSVASLKLPLLGINLAVALLLVRTLEREVGLRPLHAGLATAFFTLAAPGTAAQLLEPSGGNLEPFLYVILIWLTRNRPNWCGLVFGIGFLHREFTLYGLVALLTMEAASRTLFTRDGIRRRLVMLRAAAEVWFVVQWLHLHSSAAGPGTSVALLLRAPNNLAEIAERICFNPQMILAGAWGIVTRHWPRLFGTAPERLLDYAIDSHARQGLEWSGLVLGIAMLGAAVRIAIRILSDRRWDRRYDFCAYLVLIGLCSIGGFVIARCGEVDVMRYELLSLLGAVGVAAWYLLTERSRSLRLTWMAAVAGWGLLTAASYGQFWGEYLRHPPYGAKRLIIRQLEARGIHYGKADYWNAYYVSFLTNERIVLAADDVPRIVTYQQIVEAHASEAVRISRRSCAGGQEIIPQVYLCPY